MPSFVLLNQNTTVRIQITFKTIQTPATKEFEQGNLNIKRTIFTELHNRLS